MHLKSAIWKITDISSGPLCGKYKEQCAGISVYIAWRPKSLATQLFLIQADNNNYNNNNNNNNKSSAPYFWGPSQYKDRLSMHLDSHVKDKTVAG